MNKIKRIFALLLILTLVFSLASCGVETEKGNEIKLQCEAMIDAMIANDVDAAYSLFPPQLDKAIFSKSFVELCGYVKDVETYELKQIGWKTGIDNGLNYYIATYNMKTNAGNFIIEATVVDGYEGLYNFHIMSEEKANPTFTGTLTTIAGSNIFQLAFLAFSVLCLAFSVITLVDCAKRKMKYKALFLLIIILGFSVFTLKYSASGVNLNTHIGVMLFSYSYLQIYSTGAWTIKMVLPLGAIVYWIFRNTVTIKEQTSAIASDPVQNAENSSAEEGAHTTESDIKENTETEKNENE